MPKTTMHALDIRYPAEIRNGKLVLLTEAKETRIMVECKEMDETLIFSAQRIPGVIHEQSVPVGDILPGLSDKN